MSKLKTIIQNLKLISSKYKWLLIFALLLLLVFGISLARGGLATRPPLANRNGKFADLMTENMLTSAITNTPTPTPTLTPEQLAEIERKKFNELNVKFGPCKRVPILMYHHVLPADTAKSIGATNLNVIPETFRQQMDYLLSKGYSVVGLDQVVDGVKTNSLHSKTVALTFDDGYRDFYDYVFPILKEKNIKATVFVISQYTGGERYLVWAQVKEMSDSGLVLIGDHTLNHSNLPKLKKEEEFNQIVAAKNVIEQNIGRPVKFFAYPYGSSNQNAKDILKENGFLGAVTTMAGRTQCAGLPYDLQRIRIGGGSLFRYGL